MRLNHVEALERRMLLSVTAQFIKGTGELMIKGDNAANTIAISVSPDGTVLINGGAIAVKHGPATTANTNLISVAAKGGNDTVTVSGAGLPAIEIFGGKDNDSIFGGSGNETLAGQAGDDLIDGNQGADVALLGAGNDTFVWDPGDGSDVVEGQAGTDTLRFNGANIAESFDLSANGSRLRLFRDIGNITMDVDGVETVDLNALGGAIDTITVNDLTATDVTAVNIDLAATGGGGDSQVDNVIVNGTGGNDNVVVSGVGSSLSVLGLAASVSIVGAEPTDKLTISTLGGNDTINASSLPAGIALLTLEGGAGTDSILGSAGADALSGGTEADTIDGNQGADTALLGDGDDLFIWDPGDGSDVVEGQAGTDTLRFNGANIAESFDLSANGSRLRLFRDIGNITMDVDGVETVDLNALGGADTITVNDLTATDVTAVNVDLAATGGGGDGQVDNVIVNGTNGDDAVLVASDSSGVAVTGLAATVAIQGAETTDRLTIHALGGGDIVDASALTAAAISFIADGGDGDDAISGGAGDDTLFGGNDDDTLIGNGGTDVLDGGAGNNILIQ